MRLLPLSQGKYSVVDDDTFAWASEFRWSAVKSKHTFYAARTKRQGKRMLYFLLHREILGLTDPRVKGHHFDGNGLNNQKSNLSVATALQNSQGFQVPRRNKTSRFRGVCWDAAAKNWRSAITVKGQRKYLGNFYFEACAARAYDLAAKRFFGPFAQVNLE